jgi:glutamate/aspartate transport system substrate-binding protein
MVKSGEFARLYNRWFMSPIPPKGLNLNFPITPQLKESLDNPNDRGV